MTQKQRFHSMLEGARGFTSGLLDKFTSPEQWTYRVHDQANHALWFVGHIAVVDNFMISLVAPDRFLDKPNYDELFGMGSKPSDDPNDYPPIEEVQGFFHDRRKVLLEILQSLDEDDFDKPTGDKAPPFLKTIGSLFQMAPFHEGFHAGQVSVAARGLGIPPRV